MVTSFIIDEEYSLVFSDKTQNLVAVFRNDIKIIVPKIFNKNDYLFLYCLKSCWLTEEKPDDKIYQYFKQYIELTQDKKVKLDQVLKSYNFEQCLIIINFLYNLKQPQPLNP